MDSPFWIYCIGLSAQVFYTLRVFVQWYLSEKKGRNESPGLYWILSLAGSMTLLVYGWLRHDFSIVVWEFVTYYIYMWNIRAKGLYSRVPRIVPVLQAILPAAVLVALLGDIPGFAQDFFKSEEMPLWLRVFGLVAQGVYKSRFIYQIIYSVRRGESLLPLTFWIIALAGSCLIIAYGIIRHDWVLILGQFGIIATVRNIMIALKRPENEEVR